MNIVKKISEIFLKRNREKGTPLLIIKKEPADTIVKELMLIEESIAELEKDPNVSIEIISKLKKSFKNLKNKTSIKIKDGEIIS